MSSNDASSCADCQSGFGCMSSGTACPGECGKLLCSKCSSRFPLIVFDPSNPEESNDFSKNNEIQSFCKKCFERKSVVDFSKKSEVLNPTSEPNGVTLLFAHGGGATRALFMPHAKLLAEKGYKSILFDFPGHGALSEEPLSLGTCVTTVKTLLNEHNLKPGDKTIYIGGSMGAYIGFHILKECQEHFKGAILLDCGQNVGPGASLKARLGLWFLKSAANSMSNKSLTAAMVGATKKSPADWKLVECTYGAGFFFDQGAEQVDCIKGVAPADIIPSLEIPILFFNGSEDYRDSENKWLELCTDKRSELKVYEGGDHFFSHDSRFVDDMLTRFDSFSKAVTT